MVILVHFNNTRHIREYTTTGVMKSNTTTTQNRNSSKYLNKRHIATLDNYRHFYRDICTTVYIININLFGLNLKLEKKVEDGHKQKYII